MNARTFYFMKIDLSISVDDDDNDGDRSCDEKIEILDTKQTKRCEVIRIVSNFPTELNESMLNNFFLLRRINITSTMKIEKHQALSK